MLCAAPLGYVAVEIGNVSRSVEDARLSIVEAAVLSVINPNKQKKATRICRKLRLLYSVANR